MNGREGRKRWLPAGALQSAVVVHEDVVDDEDDDELLNGTRFCLFAIRHTLKVVVIKLFLS